MMNCIICERRIDVRLSLVDLFLFKPLIPEMICLTCKNQFERIDKSKSCPNCSKPNEESICKDCLAWDKADNLGRIQHEAIFSYNTVMQEWFKQYKFIGDIRLAKCFHSDFKKLLTAYHGWIITTIPLGTQRLNERGFNQVDELLNQAGVKVVPLFIKLDTANKAQSEKNRDERLKTPQSFALYSNSEINFKTAKIVIVDDVYTTGRTLRHACSLLRMEGVAEIRTVSLAR
ncbi:ComF family protein [Vagococcus sp. PNs007]|uniref:ComF family protein n=1 Tax=Vagococcus proximus TaxID=2991417 RepID=A0ABT5WZ83_9ENTE|nr:ComF family protein [Vagococcus proximus]MDF0479073.1 ComF family protein [Vagococcus proximus]